MKLALACAINVDKCSYSNARNGQRVHGFDLSGCEATLVRSLRSQLLLTLQCAAEITVSFRLVSL